MSRLTGVIRTLGRGASPRSHHRDSFNQTRTGPELGRVWHRKRQLQSHCDVSQSPLLVILCVCSRINPNLHLDYFSPHSSVVKQNLQNLFPPSFCCRLRVRSLKAAVGSAGRYSGLGAHTCSASRTPQHILDKSYISELDSAVTQEIK